MLTSTALLLSVLATGALATDIIDCTTQPSTQPSGGNGGAQNPHGGGMNGDNKRTLSLPVNHAFMRGIPADGKVLPAPEEVKFDAVSITGLRANGTTQDLANHLAAAEMKARTEALKKWGSLQSRTVRVAAFGGGDTPTTSGIKPADAAKVVADYVRNTSVHGVDINYEDDAAVAAGTAVPWLREFHKCLVESVGYSKSITYSPRAEWLYQGSDMVQFFKDIKGDVSWLNVQFYRANGEDHWADCASLVATGREDAAESSYPPRYKIIKYLEYSPARIVVQKNLRTADHAADFGSCFKKEQVFVSFFAVDAANPAPANQFLTTFLQAAGKDKPSNDKRRRSRMSRLD